MDRSDYAILAGIGALTVTVGVLTTSQPLGPFLVESAREAARTTVAMAWITWWALVLGFAIAGGVEAWVSTEQISDLLDGHGPRELGLATFFGFVSSSCSYSAIATAKNLYRKGASAAAALAAFQFASTNLVVEIGLVIWLLLGWEFLLADVIGGLLLIGLLSLALVYLVPDEILEAARENVTDEDGRTVQDPVCGMAVDPASTDHTREHDGRTFYFCSVSCADAFDPEAANTTVRQKATSWAGWKSLADTQHSEWAMLWDEIAIGFVFAGLIAGFVPESVWTGLFSGATFGLPVYVLWTAALGAVIGVVTFVCSVGNVPFGTVLWTRGLPFGAVLSYIFADLIVPPIVKAYDEYYGTTFAAVLSLLIFAGAVVAGFVVHFLFLWLGLVPSRASAQVVEIGIEVDYKLVLNGLATAFFAALYWLHRQESVGGGQGAAGD